MFFFSASTLLLTLSDESIFHSLPGREAEQKRDGHSLVGGRLHSDEESGNSRMERAKLGVETSGRREGRKLDDIPRKMEGLKSVSVLRRVLKLLAVVMCVAGFGWLVHKQVEKFINKKTAVAETYTRLEWHKVRRSFCNYHLQLVQLQPWRLCAQVPDVIFCSRMPFKANATWSHMLTGEAYESVLRTPQVNRKRGMHYSNV